MTLDSLLTPDRIWAALGAVGMVYLVLQVTVLARARRVVPHECEWLREEINKLRPVVHKQTSSITALNIKVNLLMRRAGMEGPAPPDEPRP